jgi:hypothetical protein
MFDGLIKNPVIVMSHFMRKVWNNADPEKFGKNFVYVSKLILNYSKFSETHPHIKYNRTVLNTVHLYLWGHNVQ